MPGRSASGCHRLPPTIACFTARRWRRTTWRLTGPDGEESVEVTARISSDEMWFIVRVTVAGMGIALLPARTAGVPMSGVGLVRVLPKLALRGGGLNIVFPSSRYLPARVSLLRDFLAVRLKAMMAR